ncbi:MAG: hypothetical protein IJL45_03035 [Prevotella sp.]|nr:hypothetical protein [Prevotella sp.]
MYRGTEGIVVCVAGKARQLVERVPARGNVFRKISPYSLQCGGAYSVIAFFE